MKVIMAGTLMALSGVGRTVCFADEKSCLASALQDYLKGGPDDPLAERRGA
jgi:hypothetical protein